MKGSMVREKYGDSRLLEVVAEPQKCKGEYYTLLCLDHKTGGLSELSSTQVKVVTLASDGDTHE